MKTWNQFWKINWYLLLNVYSDRQRDQDEIESEDETNKAEMTINMDRKMVNELNWRAFKWRNKFGAFKVNVGV